MIGGIGFGFLIVFGDVMLYGGMFVVWFEFGVGMNFVFMILWCDGVFDGLSFILIEL